MSDDTYDDTYIKIGNLYVIEFSTGVIKIGRTQQKRGHRESQHKKLAENMGISVIRSWSSVTVKQVDVLESILISYCNKLGNPRSLEYFNDLDFDAIVSFATTITEPLEVRSTTIKTAGEKQDHTVSKQENTPSSRYGQSMNPETRSRILDAVRNGYNKPEKISIYTRIPVSTVAWHLRRLQSEGLVTHDGKRKPYRVV